MPKRRVTCEVERRSERRMAAARDYDVVLVEQRYGVAGTRPVPGETEQEIDIACWGD